MTGLGAEGEPLGCGPSCSVGDCEHGHDGANDDGGCASSFGTDQRVAVAVIGLHGDGGHGEIGAIYRYHGRLGEAGFGVVFLDSGMNGDGRDYEKND